MMPFTTRILTLIALVGIGLTFWHQYAMTITLELEQHHGGATEATAAQDGVLGYALRAHRGTVAALQSVLRYTADGGDAASATIARRVVAVADLHGDLEHAHNVLRMARLIDNAGVPNWIGGHDVLVSTGDIVDRGDDTIALYELFQRLRTQARQSGGDVLNCIGNHEMMNALMDWRYVTPGDTESFGGLKARRQAMSVDGWIGREWLANYSISHTIDLLLPEHVPHALRNDYTVPRASFVHGGIHPTWAERGLGHINDVGHSLLRKALTTARPNMWLPDGTTDEEKSLYDEHGPLWYRGYALEDERYVCHEAETARRALGESVRHLVMGHTPHLSGFVVRCQASVLLIDTGISRAYGGEQSALIFDTSLQPSKSAHANKHIWNEKSTITALYRGRLPKVIDSRVRQVTL